MKTRVLSVVVALAALVLVAACAQPAPVPAPTKAPAAPAPTAAPKPTVAAPAPTAVPVAQPTAVPAKKLDFPAKDKAINLIVTYPAGSPSDVGARILAGAFEKEIGVPVQVINRNAAGGQVGITEVSLAKPDGYTMGYISLPTVITIYLDAQRKAAFGRKDLIPLVAHAGEPNAIGVRADSPYKTLKDLAEAGKANPEKIKIAVSGILAPPHLGALQLEKASGAKFAIVHFDGGAPGTTALLGGHVDAQVGGPSGFAAKPTDIRPLALFDTTESKYSPGLKTAEAQGYKVFSSATRGVILPAGTPKEVVDFLSGALKRSMDSPEHLKKLDTIGLPLKYMGPTEFAALWDDMETSVKPLMSLLNK